MRAEEIRLESICDFLFVHGRKNHESQCRSRHLFIPSDLLPKEHWMPRVGHVRLLILKMNSPTHFTVRLLDRFHPAGWKPIHRSADFMSFQIEMALLYSDEETHILSLSVAEGALCMLMLDNKPHRGLVIKRYPKE